MNRVFKEKRKRQPPKRIIEDMDNIKQEIKNILPSQKEKPIKKSLQKSQDENRSIPKKKSIPYYVAYHQNKLGQTLKTLRCKKCSGFISRGQTECKMCSRYKTRKPKLLEIESNRRLTLKTKKTDFANNVSNKKPRTKYIPKKLDIPKLESEKTTKKTITRSEYDDNPPKLLPFNSKPENNDEEEEEDQKVIIPSTIVNAKIKPNNLQSTSQKAKNKITKKKTNKRKRICECIVKEGKILICKHCAVQTKRKYRSYEPSELLVELENNDDDIPEYNIEDINIDNVQNVIEINAHDSELDLNVGSMENVIEKFENVSEIDDDFVEEDTNCADHTYAISN